MRASTYGAKSFAVRAGISSFLLASILMVFVHCGQKGESGKGEGAKNEQASEVKSTGKELAQKIRTCRMCSKPINPYTACRITVDVGKEVVVCCSHCGVMMMKKLGGKYTAGVTDCYTTGKRINMIKAFYVVGSDEMPCCFPSIIAFSTREEAEKFVEAKGGTIMTVKEVARKMQNLKHGTN